MTKTNDFYTDSEINNLAEVARITMLTLEEIPNVQPGDILLVIDMMLTMAISAISKISGVSEKDILNDFLGITKINKLH